MIKVLFFAQLREQLKCESLELEYSSPNSVSSLRESLVKTYPHWSAFLANEKLLFSVNQILVKSTQVINDGDEIAFFPPVTGG